MTTKQLIITLSILVVGFAIGASTITLKAQTSDCVSPNPTWSAPTQPPARGNACPPINTGSGGQTKTGLLGLSDLLVTNSFSFATGTNAIGKVLMDIDGKGGVGWGTVSSGSSGGSTVFLDAPIVVVSNITGINNTPNYIPWTSVNLTSLGIPSGAKTVIIQGQEYKGPSSAPISIVIRKNNSSPTLLLTSIQGPDGSSGNTSSGQGVFPINSDGTIQYGIGNYGPITFGQTLTASNMGPYWYEIDIIGYTM